MLFFPKLEKRCLNANKGLEATLCSMNSSSGDGEKESSPTLDFFQWAGIQPPAHARINVLLLQNVLKSLIIFE
jgi:hypothetical protein